MGACRDSLHYGSARVNGWEQTDGQMGMNEGRKDATKEEMQKKIGEKEKCSD